MGRADRISQKGRIDRIIISCTEYRMCENLLHKLWIRRQTTPTQQKITYLNS